MQQADRDRLDPLADQKADRAFDACLVERPVDAALRVDPLVDLGPETPLDQGRGFGPRHVIQPRHPQIADFQNVAKPLGGDESGLGALVFEDRVRGDGGAVQQLGDAGRRGADLLQQRRQPLDDRARIIVDCRRHLFGVAATVVAEQDDVGKRAADIDPGAEGCHSYPLINAIERGRAVRTLRDFGYDGLAALRWAITIKNGYPSLEQAVASLAFCCLQISPRKLRATSFGWSATRNTVVNSTTRISRQSCGTIMKARIWTLRRLDHHL